VKKFSLEAVLKPLTNEGFCEFRELITSMTGKLGGTFAPQLRINFRRRRDLWISELPQVWSVGGQPLGYRSRTLKMTPATLTLYPATLFARQRSDAPRKSTLTFLLVPRSHLRDCGSAVRHTRTERQ
jgi:hypothetical protein